MLKRQDQFSKNCTYVLCIYVQEQPFVLAGQEPKILTVYYLLVY